MRTGLHLLLAVLLAACPAASRAAGSADETIAGFSPDGALVVTATDGGTIAVHEIASGTETTRYTFDIERWLTIAIGQDGKGLTAIGINPAGSVKLVLWPDMAGSPLLVDAPFDLTDYDRSYVETPQIAPDAQLVVVRRDTDEPGFLVEVANGKVLAILGRTSARPFSPDGTSLAHFVRDSGSVTVLDLAQYAAKLEYVTVSKAGHVSYLPDGRLAVAALHGCAVVHLPRQASDPPTQISLARDGCYARDVSADGLFLIGPEESQDIILDLASGDLVWSRPSDEAEEVQAEEGFVIRDKNGRPHVMDLGGSEERSLDPGRTFLNNSYRSVVLAGGRYLSNVYGEAVQVFDLRTGRELACVGEAFMCEATRIRNRYAHALAKGRPAEIIAFLEGGANVREMLDKQWGASRLELARAHLALGNRAAARGVFAQAIDLDDLAIRAGAQIGLARTLIADGEPARARSLLDNAVEKLVAGGAATNATSHVLLRASNGMRVELSPTDRNHYEAQLAGMRTPLAAVPTQNDPVVLSEEEYAGVRDVLESSVRSVRAAGFADSVWITEHRFALFVLLGEAQTLRARLALLGNAKSRANERAAAALELLNASTLLFDGKLSNLSESVQVERLLLRSMALRQFTDDPGPEILGPLRAALTLVEENQSPDPTSLAALRVAMAEAQALVGARRDAEDSLTRAEQYLRRALPSDHPQLLQVTGMAALAATRRGEVVSGLARIEDAIALARTSSATRADRVARLAPLFGAGVEALWLAGQQASYATKLDLSETPLPLFVSLRPQGMIRHLEFSSDGGQLISREGSRLIEWDLTNGHSVSSRRINSDEGPGFFDRDEPLRFADGKRTARIGEIADTVLISGTETNPPAAIKFSSVIGAMAVSPDGHRLAVGDTFSPTLVLYDTATGQPVRQLDGHADPIRSLAWSPDSSQLASGSGSGAILLHDPEAGFVIRQLGARIGETMHRGVIEDFAFSADGNSLFTLANIVEEGDEPPLRHWDAATRRLVARFPTERGDLLVVAEDGQRLATLDSTGIDLFGIAQPGQRERGIEAKGEMAAAYQDALTFAARYDADLLLLSDLFSSRGTRSITLTDGSVRWVNRTANGDVIAIDPASRQAALLRTLSEELHVLSLVDGSEICRPEVPVLYDGNSFAPGITGPLRFTPDGTALIGIGRTFTEQGKHSPLATGIGRVIRWRLPDCVITLDLVGAVAQVDSASLALAWGGDIVAFTVNEQPNDPVTDLAFSADGTRAWAVTQENRLWLWFAEPVRAPLQLARFAAKIGKAAFSPDGTRLAVSSESGLWLWNAQTGELEGELGQ